MGAEIDEAYVKSSKAQMDHFMKLSVLAEKVKTQEKAARPIGSNKNSGAGQGSQSAASAAAEAKAKEAANAAAAGRRGGRGAAGQIRGGLTQSARQPGKPGFNFLDLLQYNYVR